MGKRAQADGVSIALPNDVDASRAKIDGTALIDGEADVDENAVSKFDGVVQAQDDDRRFPLAGAVLEHTLSSQCCLGVFADWSRGGGFGWSRGVDGFESVDIAGGECGDTRMLEPFSDQSGQESVGGPSEVRFPFRAKFSPSHEDDVGCVRKLSERARFEQVRRDGFNTTALEVTAHAGVGESGNGNGAFGRAGFGDRTTYESGKGRTHFAGHSEDKDVTFELGDSFDVGGRRAGKQFFEFLYCADLHFGWRHGSIDPDFGFVLVYRSLLSFAF